MRSCSIAVVLNAALLFAGACSSSDGALPTETRDGGNATSEADAFFVLTDASEHPDTVDASSPDAQAQAIKRLVLIVSPLGIYHKKFRIDFPGTDVEAGFERNLQLSSPVLSALLTPFASLLPQLVVVDGLTQHASLNRWVLGGPGSGVGIDELARLSVLTGAVPPVDRTSATSPSLGDLIAAAVAPQNPVGNLVVGSGLTASPKSMRFSGAYDARGALLRLETLSPSARDCIAASPMPSRGTDSETGPTSSLDFIATALQCGATRVATFDGPTTLPGFFGDVHQDCADALRDDNNACFTAYNLWTANVVAGFAKRLQAVPEGNGTMLDHTLVVWMSSEGGPTHQPYPWNAVLVGGQAMGLRTGRYLRVPQNVPTEEGFEQGSALRGGSHNHLLVSVAQLMGLQINHIGNSVFKQKTLAPIDATGPLPGL